MAEATVLGSLLIQLGMDSAQFERATARAQSSVQKMAQSIGAQAKDVVDASNRMGISITSFSNQVQTLQARLDPSIQALANYRKEVTLLKEAYRVGAISQDQFTTNLRSAVQGYRTGGTQVVASSGAMKAGMQQLNYQIGDMATMWAMGAKPQQIFASQAAQTVQAITLMTGGAGKFAKFMAGPWGIALQTAAIMLSAIIPALMKTDDAMHEVEVSSNSLADAQSALGDMFDLVTGKLKKNTSELLLNAEAKAYNMKMDAMRMQDASAKTLRSASSRSTSDVVFSSLAADQVGVPGSAGERNTKAVSDFVSSFQKDLAAAKTDQQRAAVGDKAWNRAVSIDLKGLSISREDLLGAIKDAVIAPGRMGVADAMLSSIKNGVLDPSLRNDPKDKKAKRAPKEKTQEQKDDIYQDQLDKLAKDRADIEANNNQTIEQRYQAQLSKIDEDLAAYDRNVDLNKNLTEPRRTELKDQAAINAQMKRDQALNEKNLAVANQGFELDQNSLQQQIDQLQLQEQLTDSTADRQKIALEILALQDKLKASALDQVMANNSPDTTAWQNAFDNKNALQQSAGQRQQVVLNQNLTPLQSYAKGLQASVTNINDAMENIQVDSINGLVDGLASAAAGTQKLGDVFKNVAQQIIADLVRIQLQKAIVGTLGNVLGSIGGASTGLTSSTAFSSASSYDFSAVSGVSLTNLGIAGARAKGGPVLGGLPYLVGERGPEIVVPGSNGSVISNDNLANIGGGGGDNYYGDTYYGPGADEFWGKVNNIGSANASSAIVRDKQRQAKKASRRLGKA